MPYMKEMIAGDKSNEKIKGYRRKNAKKNRQKIR